MGLGDGSMPNIKLGSNTKRSKFNGGSNHIASLLFGNFILLGSKDLGFMYLES